MPRREETQKEIPGYVARNLAYYLDLESKGDEEAEKTVNEICRRWNI